MTRLIIRIEATAVPHQAQRYDTVGDWQWEAGDLKVSVSELIDPRYELLVAYHELTEALILRHQRVSEEDVTAFDMAYEETRRLGLLAPCGCVPLEEPGDDPHALYQYAHHEATKVEMALASALDVDWWVYNGEVEAL